MCVSVHDAPLATNLIVGGSLTEKEPFPGSIAGSINTQSGVYKSHCCGDRVVLHAGEKFPGCHKHPNLPTRWRLISTSILSGDKIPKHGFEAGARVEVIGEIARFYTSTIGIITTVGQSQVPLMKGYQVKLTDGTLVRFFDFQLRVPPPTMAGLLSDNWRSPSLSGLRGPAEGRHLLFVTRDFDIHLKLARTDEKKTAFGEVTPVPRIGLVSLLIGQQQKETTTTDLTGDFKLHEVDGREVAVEIFVPGQRIICEFPVGV